MTYITKGWELNIGPFIVLCILGLLISSCTNTGSTVHNFDIEIEDSSMIAGESTLTVKQRDQVVLNIKSDEDIFFHIHGYNHKIQVQMGKATTFEFGAEVTGSFPFTIHTLGFDDNHVDVTHDDGHDSHQQNEGNKGEIELGRLDVYPR
jgi:hypothetical protein